MARKATATFPGTSTPIVGNPPSEAPRKPRMRVIDGEAPIDPTARDARKLLDARYPKVLHEGTIDAPEGAERHALEYLAESAEISRAESRKEVAGNFLRAAIGSHETIEGVGFRATWFERSGEVDWKALCKAHGISEETVEKFRRPGGRTLRVTAK